MNTRSTYTKILSDNQVEYGWVIYGNPRTEDKTLKLGVARSYAEAVKALEKLVGRKELAFDGFGINGPDEFRSRLATMVRTHTGAYTQTHINYYGKLFENAPEMLELLRGAYSYLQDLDCSTDDLDRRIYALLREFPQ